MNTLSSFFSRRHFEKMIAAIMKRFPLPALIVVILTGYLLFMIYSETDSLSTMRIVFSLIVTFFLSVGITLYSEAYGKSRWMWLSQGLAILYGGVFYFFFNP